MSGLFGPLRSVLRMAISGDKQRFDDGRVNLDLSYITDRIIAMGFPGEGVEGTYRNSIDEVATTLDLYHQDNYSVYNLAGRGYDVNKFGGRVNTWCAFPDHHPPSLVLLARILLHIHAWLISDPKHVVVVHFLAGKGRTGTVIASYMLLSGLFKTASEALSYFALRRFVTKVGVTVPGQRRYVKYIEDVLAGKKSFDDLRKQWKLQRVILRAVPAALALAPVLTVYAISGIDSSSRKVIFSSLVDAETLPPIASQKDMRTSSFYTIGHAIQNVAGQMPDASDELIDIFIPVGVLTRGDLLITLDNGKAQQCLRFNLHTGWIEDSFDCEMPANRSKSPSCASSTSTGRKSSKRYSASDKKEEIIPNEDENEDEYDEDDFDYDTDLYQVKNELQIPTIPEKQEPKKDEVKKDEDEQKKEEDKKEGESEEQPKNTTETKKEDPQKEDGDEEKQIESKPVSDDSNSDKTVPEPSKAVSEAVPEPSKAVSEAAPEPSKTVPEPSKAALEPSTATSEAVPESSTAASTAASEPSKTVPESSKAVPVSTKSDKPENVCIMSFQKWELDGSGVRSRFPSNFRVDVVFAEHIPDFEVLTKETARTRLSMNVAARFQEQKYEQEAHGEFNIVSSLTDIRGQRDGTVCWFVPEVAATVPSLTTPETPDVKVAHARSQTHAAQLEKSDSKHSRKQEMFVEKCGWLVKQGHNVRNWKRRWFILRQSVLEYYASPKDATPRGVIRLDDVCAVVPEAECDAEHQFCFEVIVLCKETKKNPLGIPFGPTSVSYFMCAADDELRNEWVESIEQCRMGKREQLKNAERDEINRKAASKKGTKEYNLSL